MFWNLRKEITTCFSGHHYSDPGAVIERMPVNESHTVQVQPTSYIDHWVAKPPTTSEHTVAPGPFPLKAGETLRLDDQQGHTPPRRTRTLLNGDKPQGFRPTVTARIPPPSLDKQSPVGILSQHKDTPFVIRRGQKP